MLHRHRFLVVGICLTGLIVAVCLFVPEFLLSAEERSDFGKVQQGHNQYYANDVSGESALDFNFQKRLMMLSGQWRCEKVETDPVVGMLSREDFMFTCEYVISTLFSEVERGLQEEQKIAISDSIIGKAEEENIEFPENIQTSDMLSMLVSIGFEKLMTEGQATLYKYTDSILNKYSFYVWEYSFDNIFLGIQLNMMVDAVTMDFYSMKFQCDYIKDLISWEQTLGDALNWDYNVNGWSVEDELYDYTGIAFGEPKTVMLMFSAGARIYTIHSELMEKSQEHIVEGEPGYTFFDGNFLMSGGVPEVDYVNDSICTLAADGQKVYAYMTYSPSGFGFCFSSDAP